MVKRIKSIAELKRLRTKLKKERPIKGPEVLVCCGTGCRANGSVALAEDLAKMLKRKGSRAKVRTVIKKTGCHGFCEKGPLVILMPAGIFYTKVKQKDVEEVVTKTVMNGEIIPRLLYREPNSKKSIEKYRDIPFYKHQNRVSMRSIGKVDPFSLEDSLRLGAYSGLQKVLSGMDPEEVIEELKISGLRGRGGAGFHTHRKWAACRKAEGERKFVLCNGDEGDPGAFKDRSIMEGDPHSVIEGMLIAAYAIGSSEGYIYVRDEYPLAIETLTHALKECEEAGLLGENILNSGFSFTIRISRGGGAFVCGESSALMRSLEGQVGEPRAKYIHASDKGFLDLPTVLNNVETLASLGAILEKGGAWFASMGTEKSRGTKAFSLVGKVKNTGLIELPMGMPLREIIFDIGGGMVKDRVFKAVQTGGPSGGCIPETLLDLPVDYEKLAEAGSMMGSGGMIVMDDRTCMVDVARYFLDFLCGESCGKCTPCREGLKQLLHLYDDIVEGRGTEEHIDKIEELSRGMKIGSLCDLGRSAPNPVFSTLQHFREEYEAHVKEKICPAGICRALTTYEILAEKCNGCGACMRVCPVAAIEGEKKKVHKIIDKLCISCGACYDVCTTDAVIYKGVNHG